MRTTPYRDVKVGDIIIDPAVFESPEARTAFLQSLPPGSYGVVNVVNRRTWRQRLRFLIRALEAWLSKR